MSQIGSVSSPRGSAKNNSPKNRARANAKSQLAHIEQPLDEVLNTEPDQENDVMNLKFNNRGMNKKLSKVKSFSKRSLKKDHSGSKIKKSPKFGK